MSNVNHTDLEAALDKYVKTYLEKVSVDNAQQVISEFNEKWKTIVGYKATTLDSQSKYGLALVSLSIAYYELPESSEKDISHLSRLVDEYDDDTNTKRTIYGLEINQSLHYNIGSCWHKLGVLYDAKALESFKKSIYYSFSLSYCMSRPITAYRFKKCSEHLYQSLINEQLNISSPTTFNDPFDSPLLELLESNSSDINRLLYQAYKECLKVACFTDNIKQPYQLNSNLPEIRNEKKRANCKEEFLNSLMWAHYADSHKGICIKYRFDNFVTKVGCTDKNVVAYFYDIEYYDGDVEKIKKDDRTISFKKAFFYKGKQWEYENELRFLYYDVNGKGDYATIDVPDSIEAIYFGLKCSEKDEKAIRKIMKDKNVQFYKMQMDEKHFGQLKAVKI